MHVSKFVAAAGFVALGFGPPAMAAEAGDWLVRGGFSSVAPKSDNGTLRLDRVAPLPPSEMDIDDEVSFTFTVSYFLSQTWAVELLAAVPFTHEYEIQGTGLHGEVDHLPPTVSLQYHFPTTSMIKPYVGVGVNWTLFSNEDINAPLDVDVEDSVGLALQTGVDFELADAWLLNLDVRYIEISGDLDVAGVNVGSVKIDPWVFGVNLGYRI